TDAETEILSLLEGLEELDLGWGIGAGNREPNGSGPLPYPCREVGGIRITDLGLSRLGRLKNLRRLDLSGSLITSAGLKHLSSLDQLQTLILWNCKSLDDSAVAALAALPKLSELDLSFTNVTDQGLPGLSQITHLKRLYLTDTRVTRSGLETVHKNK